MRKLRTRPLAFALLAAVSLGSGLRAAPQELGEREHKELGKLFEKYLEPGAQPEDLEDVRADVVKALEKIGKKLVDKDGDPIQAVLSRTADLGAGAMLANDFKNARGGKVVDGEIEGRGTKFTYSLWIPKSYRPSSGPYPAILVFPGTEEGKPMASSQFLVEHWTETAVRDAALIAVVDMPADVAAWNEMTGADGTPGGVMASMFTLKDLRDRYAVDPDRLYLLGREHGVEAAVSLGSKFPHLFAGVIGEVGDVGDVGFDNFRNLPVFLQGASAQAEAFKAASDEAGYDNCEMRPAATVDEIWAWVLEHPRIANPSKVTLALGAPIPNKAYWLMVPPTDGVGLKINAEADREANKITVTGTGVSSITLFLNDQIVDLDKPVTIVLNGVEQHDVIPRSVDDMLMLLKQGTSDPGKFYVAAKTYDLPE